MKKLFALLLLAVSFAASAIQLPPLPIDACKVHAPYGFPRVSKLSVTPICRLGYYAVHDDAARIPVVVEYVLTPEHAVGCLPRSNAFATDKSLTDGASPKEYSKSGYDIGHQANDGDNRWNSQAEEDSFILSNMAPQLPGFNRGIWKKLEDQTRGWVISRQHSIQVITGPVYDRKQDSTLKGQGRVTIPHAFFKVLIDTTTNEYLVYLLKHESSDAELETFRTSIADVQKLTGLVIPLPKGAIPTKTWPISLKSARAAKSGVCSIE